MNNFKFIHAADIHLGSILHAGEKKNSDLNELFNNAVYKAFEKICSKAIEEKVKFVLLSGDIYDKDLRSVKANSFFATQCKRLEGAKIKVFIIRGNHDPMSTSKELFKVPSNVFIFGSKAPEAVEIRDEEGKLYCRVIGQSFKENWDSRRMHEGFKGFKEDAFNIAMLHTQLDNNPNYAPCTLKELMEIKNINYFALGHIHSPHILSNKEPAIFYPGIPQGRDFGEEGQGGVLLVEVEKGLIEKVSFLPTGSIVWKRINLQIDENSHKPPENISELEEFIISNLSSINSFEEVMKKGFNIFTEGNPLQGYIVSCCVSGRGNIYHFINDKQETEDYLLESLNSKLLLLKPFIYINSMQLDISRPVQDMEGMISENSTFKAVSSTASKFIEDDAIKNQLLKELGALWEHTDNIEDINIKKLQLFNEDYEDIIAQAEQLIIELLLQRSESYEN